MEYEEDEELKALLAKRKEELARVLMRQREAEEERLRREMEREAILRTILTENARERLARIRLARPEFAKVLEDQLILLAQSGRISIPINDEQLKEILRRLHGRKKGGEIVFKRKGEV